MSRRIGVDEYNKLRNPRMNKTEQAFAMELSNDRYVLEWFFEGLKLRLGDNLHYTPDFFVYRAVTIQAYETETIIYEVKGTKKGKPYYRGDARAKLKMAAARFPFWKFYGVHMVDGLWQYEEIKSA